ncbi:MAG TPA: hypothetical protein VML75_29390 [Kofleriaceae bacterium]|nr:hypothetical protein [Kofleriaceae bacterium]
MIRTLIWLALIVVFIWFGATVNLGRRTLFGHIGNIWSSDEASEMREDVKEHAGPALGEAKDRAKAGWKAMKKDLDAGTETGSTP